VQTFVFVFSNNAERKISAENLEKAIKIAEKSLKNAKFLLLIIINIINNRFCVCR
jgi:hypothetical protein